MTRLAGGPGYAACGAWCSSSWWVRLGLTVVLGGVAASVPAGLLFGLAWAVLRRLSGT